VDSGRRDLRRQDGDAHRTEVLRNLRARFRPPPSEATLDDAYQEAWVALLQFRRAGQEPHNVGGWLFRVAERHVIGEFRRACRRSTTPLDDVDAVSSCDLVEDVHERWNRRLTVDCLRRHFDPVEQQVLLLTYGVGWSRARVAEELGVSPKRLKKLLDGHDKRDGLRNRAEPHLRALVDGRLCETYESLIAAWQLGWFSPGTRRDIDARAHLRACPSCRMASVRVLEPSPSHRL
jgi:RNA polymerase sigma factor (sigma-70 family)